MSYRDWETRPEEYVPTLGGLRTPVEVLADLEAEEEEYDRTCDYADLACCIGCGARISPGPVRCPLCAGMLERPAAA